MQTVTPRARGRVVQGEPDNPITLEVDSPQVRDVNGQYVNTNDFLRLDLEDLPLPSFHRPDLENFWFHRLIEFRRRRSTACRPIRCGAGRAHALRCRRHPRCTGISDDDPTGVDVAIRDQIVAMKRKISLRPLREDHPNFDGSNPASRPRRVWTASRDSSATATSRSRSGKRSGRGTSTTTTTACRDSVWVDLGDPVAQAEDGTLYKPLYAFLIVDLDSRLNVNAHGLVDDLTAPADPFNLSRPGNLGRIESPRVLATISRVTWRTTAGARPQHVKFACNG